MVIDSDIPPHDLEAEESVIGSLIIDPSAITTIIDMLSVEDFYSKRNQICYKACINMFQKDIPINQITLAHEINLEEDSLKNIGGVPYITSLVSRVFTSIHIEHYAKIVVNKAIHRQIIRAGNEIAKLGFSASDDADISVDHAEEIIFSLRNRGKNKDFTSIRNILDMYLESSMADLDAVNTAPIESGFVGLDTLLGGGMQRSDLIIIAARPSVGKTSLAMSIALQASQRDNTIGIFSLEMSAEQIVLRMLTALTNINGMKLRSGLLTNNDLMAVMDGIGYLSDLPIYIDDSPTQTPLALRSKARRLKQELGSLDLIIVDYLQLVDTGSRNPNRAIALGEVSRSLKALAREVEIPVIACSQLSRAIESRPDHRPILSDLRESGNLEQDADIVAFIHREDRYITEEEWGQQNHSEPYPENKAEIIIAKHRNGALATVELIFESELVKFTQSVVPTI